MTATASAAPTTAPAPTTHREVLEALSGLLLAMTATTPATTAEPGRTP